MTKCISVDYIKNRITSKFFFDLTLWMTVAAPMTYLLVAGQPRERGFFCDDNSIKYPNTRDTIPTTLLVILGFTIFFLVILLVEILNCIDRRCSQSCLATDSLVYCVKGYLLLNVGFVCQQLVVQVVKQQTGFLRPNFWNVCQPSFNQSQCGTYISEYTCTNDDLAAIKDSRESFPSGHAAFSMYFAVFLSIYIQRRLHIHFSRVLKPLLQFGVVFLSILCGQGRIIDNKHHMIDVIMGHVLGICAALTVFATLGNTILKPTSSNDATPHPLSTEMETSCCCACADPDPDACPTPSPLLQNEYTTISSQDIALSMQKSSVLNGLSHSDSFSEK